MIASPDIIDKLPGAVDEYTVLVKVKKGTTGFFVFAVFFIKLVLVKLM